MAATAHRGYWSACYCPQYSLVVLAWLLQAPGWPGGTSLAAAGPSLAWGTGVAATGPCWPGGTGLATTGPRLVLGTGLTASANRGYWPGCNSPQYSLVVLAWLLQAPGLPGGNGLATTGRRFAPG